MSDDPFNDPALPGLVSTALELLEDGGEDVVDEVCRERPDLKDAVAQSIESCVRMGNMQRAAAQADTLVGMVLGERYRLEGRIGAGAMGVVYKGEDIELRRPVAVKILRATFVDGTAAEQRFAREAEALAAIDHPVVVTIHDTGRTAEGDPFLVMELLSGASLADLLEQRDEESADIRGRWLVSRCGDADAPEQSDLRLAVRWCAELAAGLDAAHARDILHRDVKPSNVFIRPDGRPVLLDFGVAARLAEATITAEGSTVGTPAYMAPEALSSEQPAAAPLDVYGLTAMLYHMLTGQAPFQGSPTQVLAQLATREPRPAYKLRPGLPRDLIAILERGMARRTSDRYPHIAALRADLEAFLDHRPVSARPLTPWVRAARRARRSPVFLSVIGVLALLGLGLGAKEIHASWERAQREKTAELWTHVPPYVTLGNPDYRVLNDAEGREEVAALLDEIAAVCIDPLPTFLVRASFAHVHGRPADAARDMEYIAEELDTPYLHALARRYRALADGSEALDLTGLPEPDAPMDVYVAAYHLYRDQHKAEAVELLEHPDLVDFGPAQELLAMELYVDPPRMLERVRWLETHYGRRTAMTAHLLGLVHFIQGHKLVAYDVVQSGVALAPKAFILHQNSGLYAHRDGRIEEARRHIERTLSIKPNYMRAHSRLIKILNEAGELDRAQEQLDVAPFGADDKSQADRFELQGEILTEFALRSPTDAVEYAKEALDAFASAADLGHPVDTAAKHIADALAKGLSKPAFMGLIKILRKAPLSRRRLQLLLDRMPADLDLDQTNALRAYLESLRKELDKRAADTGPPSTPE